MSHFFEHFWPHITTAMVLVVELLAAGHAVLYKRDSRSTIGWVGLILLTPLFGAVLYWMFGINRIHRKAKLRRGRYYQCRASGQHAYCDSGIHRAIVGYIRSAIASARRSGR